MNEPASVAADFRRRGDNVTIYSGARVIAKENIALASNIIIDDFVFIGRHEELVIGNYIHITSFASITGGGRCILADFCGVSSGARVLTGSDSFTGAGLTNSTIPPEFRAVERSTVIIESHAVVGVNAVILPGVTIGEGAAIAAGAVLTRSAEPWTIYAGCPARPVRPRPSEQILRQEQLLYEKYGRPSWQVRVPLERASDPNRLTREIIRAA